MLGQPPPEKIDAEYISFFQTPWDRVKYLFPGMDKNVSMSYVKFRDWLLKNFVINDRQQLLSHLDSFDLILLLKTGEFFIIKDRKDPFNINFSDLWQFNQALEEKDKKSDFKKRVDFGLNMLQEKVKKDFDKYVTERRRFKKGQSHPIVR